MRVRLSRRRFSGFLRARRVFVVGAFALSPALVLVGSASPAYAAVVPVAPVDVPADLARAVNDVFTGDSGLFGKVTAGLLQDGAGGGAGDIIGYGGGGGAFGIGGAASGAGAGFAAYAGVAIAGFTVGYGVGTMALKGYQWLFGPTYPTPDFDAITGTGSGKCYARLGTSGYNSLFCSATFGTVKHLKSIIWVGVDGSGNRVGTLRQEYDAPLSTSESFNLANIRPCVNDAPYGLIQVYATWATSATTVASKPLYTFNVDCGTDVTNPSSYPSSSWPGVNEGTDGGGALPYDAPQRQLVTTAECVNASTGVLTERTASSAVFHEQDATRPAVPDLACVAGEYIQSAHVDEINPQDSNIPAKRLYTFAPDGAWGSLFKQFPDCVQSTCLLTLKKVVGSDELSCNDGDVSCAGWFTDPTATTDYRCYWGAYAVALQQCETYKDAFEVATPGQLDDPTGAPVGQPTGGTSGFPSSGDSPSPGDGTSCLSGFWSWNPIDWVYTPVKCALQWAFDPGADYLTQKLSALQTAWDASVFGQVTSVVGNVGSAFVHDPGGVAGDCTGPSFDVGHVWQLGDGQYLYQPLYACDGIGKTVHDFVEPFIIAFLWLATLWTSYNHIVRSIGQET